MKNSTHSIPMGIVAAMVATGVQAALVTFSADETRIWNTSTAHGSVDAYGTAVVAINVNNTAATVNGIDFLDWNSGSATANGVTMAVSQTGGTTQTWDADYINNPEIDAMLDGIIYSGTTSNDAVTVSLSGLTVGQSYQLQFFFGQNGADSREFTVQNASDATNESPAYDSADSNQSYYHFTATWTADSTTQGFDMVPTAGFHRAVLSGISLLVPMAGAFEERRDWLLALPWDRGITFSVDEIRIWNTSTAHEQVDTNGTAVVAINVNSTAATVNGIDFMDWNSGSATANGVTMAVSQTGGLVQTVASDYVDSELTALIDSSIVSGFDDGDVSVDLSGLAIGQVYQLQFFFGQKKGPREFTVQNASDASNESPMYDNTDNNWGYYHFTATWTADSTTHGFDMLPALDSRAVLCGASLLEIQDSEVNGDDLNTKSGMPFALAHLYKTSGTDAAAQQFVSNALADETNFDAPLFNPVGVIRAVYLYDDQFNQSDPQLLPDLAADAREILDWTGGGTENHRLMRWSNGYLLAQKFGGSWHPTTSPSTWWTSAALMADLKGKLLAEGKFRYDNAGMSEYLSPNYLLHHILPLLNLYDFCEDAELKNVAEAMLHLHLTHLALNVHRNYILEPTTRLGGITYPEYNNTQFIPWLYWNTFQPDPERLQQRNVSGTHLVYAALSGFRPHAALESLATGNGHVPFTTRSLGMNWVQSTEVDRSPRTDFRKIYRAQEYAIGTGNNRHAPDGFYMNHSKFAITWTSDDYLAYLQCSHPYWRSDESETSWWKAPTSPFQQIALHENTAIVLFNIPQTDPWPNAGRADWLVSRDGHTNNLITKARIRFPLSMDERVVYDIPGGNERWYFLREGNVYIGIRALTASDKATQDTNFERINADAVLNGDRYQTGFVFEIGTASEYGTFAAFQAALKTHSIQVDWGTGTVPQPSVSYTNEQGNSVELVYNNNLLADANGIVFNLPVVTINGLSEDTAAWPDIEGPDVLLENSILTVFGAGGVCQVDWSGVQPDIFSAGEDGDNMDAAWEMAYFGDTLRDGSGDFDLDGYLDVQEFYADLDPTNSASVLKIVDVELDGGASTVSYLNGGTNADVFMEFRTNMMSGGWVVVDTNMAPSSTSNISIHTHDEDAGFYRLRAERR